MASSPPSHDDLITRIRAGDREAFENVFRAHHPGLLRFAFARMRDRAAAEDVVHDVFLRLWRTRADLHVRGSLRNYLVTAVRNRVIDIRRQQTTEQRSVELMPAAAPAAGGRAGPHGQADPAQLAELREAIAAGLAALPDRCRTAFLLCREQDMTYAEAAGVMGVSPATVKTQIARALASLRGVLEPFLVLIVAAGTTLR